MEDRERSEPDRAARAVGPLAAVGRHWFLALVPTLVLVGLALAISADRAPTYAAEARLNAGTLDVETQAIPGFLVASQSLAALYSRTLDAERVVAPISDQLGLAPGAVRSRLSASPIPESSMFVIEARGPSAASAVTLANTASKALIDYVASLDRPQAENRRLLGEVNEASLASARAASIRDEARAAYTRTPSETNRDALEEATAEAQAANLKLETLSALYVERYDDTSASGLVQVITPAREAWSDRASVVQRFVALAIIVGALTGLALASFRANLPGTRRRSATVARSGLEASGDGGEGPPRTRLLSVLLMLTVLVVAGFLLALSSSFDLTEVGEFWAAVALVAAAGLVLGLVRLLRDERKLRRPGISLAVLGVTAFPASAIAAWALLGTQPKGGWQRERVEEWSASMGVFDAIHSLGEHPLVLAFGVGLVFALALEAKERPSV